MEHTCCWPAAAAMLIQSGCAPVLPAGILAKPAAAAGRGRAVEGLEAGAHVAVSGQVLQLAAVVAVGALRGAAQACAAATESAAIGAVGEGAQVGGSGVAAVEGAAVQGAVCGGDVAPSAARAHAASAAAAVLVQI